MSKLDERANRSLSVVEMIKELCPDGVEYKTLGEVCEIGKGVQFNKENMSDEGSYPVINGGINPSGYIEQYNQNENTITISQGGASAGYVNWIDKKFWAGAHCYVLKPNETTVQNRYVFHFIKSKEYRLQECQYGAGIPALAKSTVAELEIPIPPLPVQEEIVRILDTFTSLTAELTAELTARRKQYEYYRDALLTRDTKIEQTTLDKISENCDSQRKPVTSGNRIKGDYPYYGASGIVDYVNDYIFDGDYLLVSEDGANLVARSTPIAFSISGKNWVNNHAHILKFKESATRKFVEHYLNSINLEKYISGGAQPKLNQQNLNKIPIPLPPLSVQQRIVNVLDNFDAICSDLKIGLPAEIDARKKQYEYYRDLLLTFAERGNTIFADSRQQTADSR